MTGHEDISDSYQKGELKPKMVWAWNDDISEAKQMVYCGKRKHMTAFVHVCCHYPEFSWEPFEHISETNPNEKWQGVK